MRQSTSQGSTCTKFSCFLQLIPGISCGTNRRRPPLPSSPARSLFVSVATHVKYASRISVVSLWFHSVSIFSWIPCSLIALSCAPRVPRLDALLCGAEDEPPCSSSSQTLQTIRSRGREERSSRACRLPIFHVAWPEPYRACSSRQPRSIKSEHLSMASSRSVLRFSRATRRLRQGMRIACWFAGSRWRPVLSRSSTGKADVTRAREAPCR